MGSVIGGVVGGVGSILGGNKASDGAKDAAKTQAQSADRAAQLQMDMFQQQQQYLDPYRRGGYTAQPLLEYLTTGVMPTLNEAELAELQQLQGIGQPQMQQPQQPQNAMMQPQQQYPLSSREQIFGPPRFPQYPEGQPAQYGQQQGPQVQMSSQPGAMTQEQKIRLEQLLARQQAGQVASAGMQGMVENSPMYQYQSDTGNKQMNRMLNARGRGNSTFGVNALGEYNRGLIANEYGNMYNRLADQANAGMGVARQAGQNAMYAGQDIGRMYQNAGNAIAQGQSTAGQLQGSMYANVGNALGYGLSNMNWPNSSGGNFTPTMNIGNYSLRG